MKNLVYCCAFHNRGYEQLVNLLVKSFSNHTHTDTHLLVMCHEDQADNFRNIFSKHHVKCADVFICEFDTKFQATCARLNIFSYPAIDQYDKILYIDCDVLVMNTLDRLFYQQLHDMLYVHSEPFCKWWHWNETFQLPDNHNRPEQGDKAFTTGMMLFNNTTTIRALFDRINTHIHEYVQSNDGPDPDHEQPFIVYHTMLSHLTHPDKQMIMDNRLLESNNLAMNHTDQHKASYTEQVLVHFPGSLGEHQPKLDRMKQFYEQHVI